MLKDAIRREGETELAQDLADRLQSGQPRKSNPNFSANLVPDDIVIDLVRDRLERPDCRTNGWILEGCPMTQNQIRQIKDLMIVPQVVVAFEMSDEAVLANLDNASEEGLSKDEVQEWEKKLNDYRDFLSVAETEFN